MHTAASDWTPSRYHPPPSDTSMNKQENWEGLQLTGFQVKSFTFCVPFSRPALPPVDPRDVSLANKPTATTPADRKEIIHTAPGGLWTWKGSWIEKVCEIEQVITPNARNSMNGNRTWRREKKEKRLSYFVFKLVQRDKSRKGLPPRLPLSITPKLICPQLSSLTDRVVNLHFIEQWQRGERQNCAN